MKFFTSLLLLTFVVGTFSYSLSRTSLLRKVRNASSGEKSSSESKSEEEKPFLEFFEVVVMKCYSVNGEAAIDQFQAAVITFGECIEKATESISDSSESSESKEEDKSTELTPEEIKEVFLQLCPVQQAVFQCVEKLSEAGNICLEPKEQEVKNNLVNTVKTVADYVCINNGEKVIQFFEDDGLSCVISQADETQKCVGNAKKLIDETDELDFLSSPVSCNEYKDEKECVVNALAKCEKKTPSTIIADLLDKIWSTTQCAKLVSNDESVNSNTI